MKTTKLEITPEIRAFNDAVEMADLLTDYQHDRESAEGLLKALIDEHFYPHSVEELKNAMAGMAVKK